MNRRAVSAWNLVSLTVVTMPAAGSDIPDPPDTERSSTRSLSPAEAAAGIRAPGAGGSGSRWCLARLDQGTQEEGKSGTGGHRRSLSGSRVRPSIIRDGPVGSDRAALLRGHLYRPFRDDLLRLGIAPCDPGILLMQNDQNRPGPPLSNASHDGRIMRVGRGQREDRTILAHSLLHEYGVLELEDVAGLVVPDRLDLIAPLAPDRIGTLGMAMAKRLHGQRPAFSVAYLLPQPGTGKTDDALAQRSITRPEQCDKKRSHEQSPSVEASLTSKGPSSACQHAAWFPGAASSLGYSGGRDRARQSIAGQGAGSACSSWRQFLGIPPE